METEILVALIAAGATLLTIIGSIVAVKMAGNAQIKEQQIAADREMKRKYYTKFVDAFTKKLFYINKPECVEKIEAEMEFVLEANKLPMYASREMLLFIETIKNPEKAKSIRIQDFLIIMRNDLCENSFDRFPENEKLSLVLPQKVIGTSLDGIKKIL